ncbi:MAG: four helix bundle protein [Deltaproteobacteria bacterium]|nr:MAG: four helix bundle protein [Deltaproteobacteria bacterium]
MKSFRELKVWKKAYDLCLEIFRITKKFPREERYVLSYQMRKSALSIPSNIAEGYGRKTRADYIRILYIAYGSACELDTQISLSGDLNYIQETELENIKKEISEVGIMLRALIRALKKTSP